MSQPHPLRPDEPPRLDEPPPSGGVVDPLPSPASCCFARASARPLSAAAFSASALSGSAMACCSSYSRTTASQSRGGLGGLGSGAGREGGDAAKGDGRRARERRSGSYPVPWQCGQRAHRPPGVSISTPWDWTSPRPSQTRQTEPSTMRTASPRRRCSMRCSPQSFKPPAIDRQPDVVRGAQTSQRPTAFRRHI